MIRIEKMVFRPYSVWLLILVFFSIYAWKINIFGEVALYKMIYPALFVFFLIQKKFNKNTVGKNLRVSTYCWSTILLWGLFSLLWININGTEFNYLSYDLCWICITLCFSYYALTKRNRERLMIYFCGFALVIGLMGIYTSFTGYYFNDTHASYHHIKNFLGLYRPNGVFFNINDNAVFMFFSIVLIFLLTENKKNSLFWRSLGLAIFGGNILLVDSRGVELGLLIFLILYLFKTKKIKKIYKIIMIMGMILFSAFSLDSIMNLGLFDEGLQDSGRLSIIEMSFFSLSKTNFMGVGPGNIASINASLFSAETVAPHNFFIEVFCDYGIIGLIALVIWFASNLKCTIRMMRYDNRALVIWASWIAFLVISIVSSSLIGKSWVACYFGIMVAYLNSIECYINTNEER